MTRFEILQLFASDGKASARHIALFYVLSEMWVSSNRPETFEPDFDEVARLLGIAYSSAMRWLNELEEFHYIELRRGRNQHEKSTLVFKVGHASTETAHREMRNQTSVASASIETAHREMRDQTGFGPSSTETAPLELRQHRVNRDSEVMREMRQHDVDRDSTASIERADIALSPGKTAIPGNEGTSVKNSGLAQPLLAHNNNNLIIELSNNSKGEESGNYYDEKGVQGKKQKSPKRSNDNQPVAVCSFADSPLADILHFREAFASDRTAQVADLDYYHERLLNWRDKKGNTPKRSDWLAIAKTFLLNDYREGKLVTVPTTLKSLHNAKSRNHSRSAVIEPESTTGRRFGNW